MTRYYDWVTIIYNMTFEIGYEYDVIHSAELIFGYAILSIRKKAKSQKI